MTTTPSAGIPATRAGRSSWWARSTVLIGAALAVALGLAGCSSPATTPATTSTSSSSTSSSTSTSTSTGSTGSSTSTTGASGVATCLASQLQIAPLQGNGAAGTIYQTVSLTNTSSATCTLDGYPGMQLLDAQGSSIPTNVVRGGSPSFPTAAANQPPATVTLAPQQAAVFSLDYEDVPVGDETSCPTSTKAQITPPNDTASAVVTLQITACGGGTVHVSPVYASS